MPSDVIEADICERFGWTFTQLDNEDQDRVLSGVAMQNIRDALGRIRGWLSIQGKGYISDADLELYKLVIDAEAKQNGTYVEVPKDNIDLEEL